MIQAEPEVVEIESRRAEQSAGPLGYVREHPGWVIYFLSCTVLGAVGIFYVPFVPEGMNAFQKAAGGGLAGFYFSLFPIVHRLFL